MKLDKLRINPDNPRSIDEDKFNKLKKSIVEFPEMMELRPIVVDDDFMVLGGNMRLKALQDLGYDKIPASWIKKAKDLTPEQKKEFIVKDNVGFGKWDFEALANFYDIEELQDWGLQVDWPEENDSEEHYTTKIEAPTYEPTEDVKLEDCFDNVKANSLILEIENSSIEDPDVKNFLKLAATRHIVFDYEKLANYYAAADPQTQDLMEKSALVIIDFDKVIEYGFAELTEGMKKIMEKEADEK